MGLRPHPMVVVLPEDDQSWLANSTSSKDVSGQPDVPADRSGFREERLGSMISRHLNTSAESIGVNVGGPCVEGCSPPRKCMGVGGVIVLGGRESRPHGEGRQGIDVRWTNSQGSPWESLVSLVKRAALMKEKPMTATAGSRQSLESRVR